ncbi:MAG: rhodanese-like domain-containing protein [Candidatus Tectomicrobia bacterium]|jgi:thiosulfate/3-mercaptopyruvate sulfurtransferase|nr:rhodanese-like domain-containing protein [Candidatus Tectomicrobia bacterium]
MGDLFERGFADTMVDKGYAHPDLLWSPQELEARLGDPHLRIIDVRPTHALVQEGWIPGAIHFDLFGMSLNDTAPQPLQAFMWMIEHLFEMRGVNLDTPVVFYEDIAGMRAARGFWFLEYFGHGDVHVLDGGLSAWKAAGLPRSHEMRAPRGTTFQSRPRPELHWSADELYTHLRDADLAIIDTRTDDEYLGKSVRAARGGTIPGAIHLEWTHNLDADGAFKTGPELQAMYEAKGITRDKTCASF